MYFVDTSYNSLIKHGEELCGDKVEIAVGSTEIKAFDRVVVFALPDAVERVCDFFN